MTDTTPRADDRLAVALRDALAEGLAFLLDNDDHVDDATAAVLPLLRDKLAALPTETVTLEGVESAYGDKGAFKRETVTDPNTGVAQVCFSIYPEGGPDDEGPAEVEWFAYLTAEQWAAVSA